MSDENILVVEARIIATETKQSKRGNKYTTVSARVGNEVVKMFSDVSLEEHVDEDVRLQVKISPDQGGMARVSVVKVLDE